MYSSERLTSAVVRYGIANKNRKNAACHHDDGRTKIQAFKPLALLISACMLHAACSQAPVSYMTAISFKNNKHRRPESSPFGAQPSSTSRTNKQRFLLLTALVASLGLVFFSHAWTPPIEHVVKMAGLFQRNTPDPNSIDGRTAIGYWHDEGRGSAQNAVEEGWDPNEREMVLNYLKLASKDKDDGNDKDVPHVLQQWRGLAFCRICEEMIGNSCNGDSKYNWPEGYAHYIEKHSVKPPQKFIDHVRQQTKILQK